MKNQKKTDIQNWLHWLNADIYRSARIRALARVFRLPFRFYGAVFSLKILLKGFCHLIKSHPQYAKWSTNNKIHSFKVAIMTYSLHQRIGTISHAHKSPLTRIYISRFDYPNIAILSTFKRVLVKQNTLSSKIIKVFCQNWLAKKSNFVWKKIQNFRHLQKTLHRKEIWILKLFLKNNWISIFLIVFLNTVISLHDIHVIIHASFCLELTSPFEKNLQFITCHVVFW